jgi:predicted nucleic acid-binding protein
VKLVVDTGVFSAALSRRRRVAFEPKVRALGGNQLFLAAQTVAELRYGAIVAEWGEARQTRLEAAIAAATVVPVTDAFLHRTAHLRYECRSVGHPLAAPPHNGDLWIAATALHLDAPLVTADGIFDGVPGLSLA